jgi:hypothetical protein
MIVNSCEHERVFVVFSEAFQNQVSKEKGQTSNFKFQINIVKRKMSISSDADDKYIQISGQEPYSLLGSEKEASEFKHDGKGHRYKM